MWRVLEAAWCWAGCVIPGVFEDGTRGWQMDFYIENAEEGMDFLFSGPPNMKDIRLLEWDDGRVLVLTRPQGFKGGRGRIGYYLADSLESISAAEIYSAPLLDGLCAEEEWVGANEAHRLTDGRVGILGHVAKFRDSGERVYQAMVFCLDVASGAVSPPRVIARRADFPDGPAKRADLTDVLFSGGLVRLDQGEALLYVGLSDAESGCMRIADPFLAYEQHRQEEPQ